MSIFSKFANKVDKEQLEKDIQEAQENQGGEYKEVPAGTYVVEIEKIECKETAKTGMPMVSIWFEILEGEHKGQKLFFNQVLQVGTKNLGWQINKLITFVHDLDTGVILEDKTDLSLLEDWLEEVFDQVEDLGLEYEIEYSQDKKGYDVFKITQVFVD